MSYDRYTLERIRTVPLLEVAARLQLRFRREGRWYISRCFLHDDRTPSLGFCPATGRWRCFGCGAGGDVIELVKAHEGMDFEEAVGWIGRQFGIDLTTREEKFRLSTFLRLHCMNLTHSQYLDSELMKRFEGTQNSFTRAMTQTGFLTAEQMARAAVRFRLSTVDDRVVFWMIDREGNLREGKVMAYAADGHRSHQIKPCTVSWMLRHEGLLPADWQAQRCLFGLHQLAEGEELPVAVVESEKTAILCSELLADEHFVWMATGGASNLSLPLLEPLRGRRIILFPDTDSDGTTYRSWAQRASEAAKAMGHPVTVSNLLERYASSEERKRKIDLADFLLDHRGD